MMPSTVHKANLLMRACPRCQGDLYRDMLESDVEYVCLQCGRRTIGEKLEVRLAIESRRRLWRRVA
jgi:uncharacterized protein (DUF983 family)